ncbi:exonuclease subunit SbcD [Colwellia sp. UCD-KL20]|uniref:exonuclease subunit SbcD n=1 Tax=Colwellia sp. UCD-KL20 TaxID=1917165 RepID=UPI000970CE63|nr:exonuclease subunit SbcD [Colwellia sp. UCD-KL20]
MKILHTSDWHLGQHFYGKSRAKEHQLFIGWLLEQVQENSIDAVIVAGDIFDTGTPPSYAREMYFDFISQMHNINCQLIIMAGNHDSVAMLGESKTLLKSLSTRVIPAVTDNIDEQVFTINNKQGEAQAVICAIPFIRPRDVIKSSAGQSASQKQQSLQQAISGHYQTLFDQAENLSKGQYPIIATGHLTTVGVTTSESVRDIYIGTLEAFPANAFPDADYIALGHIHRAQKVAKTEHIRYCGSPIPLSFDEASQTKRVVMVEFLASDKKDAFERIISEIDIPCFQPLVTLKTNLESLNKDIAPYLSLVDSATSDLQDNTKIWLDIEINSAEYLQDLTARIETLIEDFPVEILLIRRSKKARELMPSHQKKITLNELSLDEVFESRLAVEHWETEEQQARKTRITHLFQHAVEEAQEELNSKTVKNEEKAQ